MKIIGPFKQIVTLRGLPLKGALGDESLEILTDAAVLVDGNLILQVDSFEKLSSAYPQATVSKTEGLQVLLPAFIDCHTHICFAGSRARDYAMRVAGKSYLEIAKAGGGIWDSVQQTRQASLDQLTAGIIERAHSLLRQGITTVEVKSGYGLNMEAELNMLRAIQQANDQVAIELVPTCLAAHMKPKDFEGSEEAYLHWVLDTLLPIVQDENLARRVDIFIEESAFDAATAAPYLQAAKNLGFDITVHADQFSTGGSAAAVAAGAISADHLEASTATEISMLAASETVSVVLPGASLGLGMNFAPARKLLDAGACVAISSDWNPGSAPMGDLITQAAVLGAFEKLSIAETLAGLTFRAAKALNLTDRGRIEGGMRADMQAYDTSDYRTVFYHQGSLKPMQVWKSGQPQL